MHMCVWFSLVYFLQLPLGSALHIHFSDFSPSIQVSHNLKPLTDWFKIDRRNSIEFALFILSQVQLLT